MANLNKEPITLLICALGGEGGGVLVEWLVRTATASGFPVQSTSIPGVAQRTGSTTYYVEIYPVPNAELGGKQPVFSLYPVPGALDILVSSELLETVRQVSAGMVSPERTRVITSTSRTLTTIEKMQLSDGRMSSDSLLEITRKFSLDCHAFDMNTVARETGTIVSAVMMGAIAGSALLPFSREAFEATVQHSGRGVDASLRGFALAFDAVSGNMTTDDQSNKGGSVASPMVPEQVRSRFPQPVAEVAALGYARLSEYQDAQYADLYLSRLERVLLAERSADPDAARACALARETARYLATWMAFDDIVRVADLKSRWSRSERVRRESGAQSDEVVRVYDYFKPGLPELAALLPHSFANRLMRWENSRKRNGKSPISFPLKVAAHSVTGFAALRLLASLRWLRKRGSRYTTEQAMIERWLGAVEQGARSGWQLGYEIALCGRLIKGYGATNDRGKGNLLHILDHLANASFESVSAHAEAIRAARISALADDSGKRLDQALVKHGAPARPVKAQPVVWMKKPRQTVQQ